MYLTAVLKSCVVCPVKPGELMTLHKFLLFEIVLKGGYCTDACVICRSWFNV